LANDRISVIIPVYNGEKYLQVALDSVHGQNFESIEVIVVDDGSVDGTALIAKSNPKVRYIFQENQGHAVAKNTGLLHSTGNLISFLDADDFWPANKLQVQYAHLKTHPDLGCVIGKMRNFLDGGISRPEWIPGYMLADDGVALSLGAMLAHQWVFDQIGHFNVLYWHGNDLDWFIRLTEAKIPMGIMPDVFLHRRIHSSNLSKDQNVLARERIRILKASMDRKRGLQVEPIPGIR
jgi:glycosyltransferase involved in cell wall biosynthesis